jgi:hypothetical protein
VDFAFTFTFVRRWRTPQGAGIDTTASRRQTPRQHRWQWHLQ